MAATTIEWADKVWNPIRGCRRVSEGCRNCYAERQASRFSGPGLLYDGLTRNGKWTGEARFIPEMLAAPLSWRKPSRVFVNSMSDLFHEDISNEQIAAIFGVMAACPQHTFQVLTKRPHRASDWFVQLIHDPDCDGLDGIANVLASEAASETANGSDCDRDHVFWLLRNKLNKLEWPLPNVHIGVSVEDQRTADERIPSLLSCPAAVRWVSVEPMLGPVDLTQVDATKAGWIRFDGSTPIISAFGKWQEKPMRAKLQNGIDWVVCGGESGPGARPMHPDWARSLRDQCRDADVPFFFKQLGGLRKKSAGNLLDGERYEMRPGDHW